MWFLKGEDNSHLYMPLHKENYSIGKHKSADLMLNHSSTDDFHAKITIVEKTKTIFRTLLNYKNRKYLTCTIMDLDSTTGTFLGRNGNFNKLDPWESCQLTAGDRLKFGKDPNVYEVNFEKAIVCVSEKYDQREKVIADLEKLGITVYKRLNSQCTHFVHPDKSMTHRYASALAQGVWITGPEFWRDCVKAYVDGTAWPNVIDYEVKIKFSAPNSLIQAVIHVNFSVDRSQLFRGMTFVFFSTYDIDDYGRVVKSASGNVELYSKVSFEDKKLDEKLLLVKPYVRDKTLQSGCVINHDDYNQILLMMEYMKRRVITKSEITAAILKNSTEIYCNQFISLDDITGRKRPAETALVEENNSSKVIVLDDDSDDDAFGLAAPKSTNFKKFKTNTENINPQSSDFMDEFTLKKSSSRKNLPDKVTWLSSRSGEQFNPVTKTETDEMKPLSTPESPAKAVSLKRMITLSHSIGNHIEAIKKIQDKLSFDPFKPMSK
ncbi:nibrin-like [Cotesia typhae]|uniref:nibrin-like n=1 Tax=Cotesia typhae TaxID=2053667 RepID=UPI003D69197C